MYMYVDDDDVENYDEHARDDYHDEWNVMKCIMMSCDWNSLFGKFWEAPV